MIDNDSIVAGQQMVIRRPVSEVFNAFVDPEVTTRFWFNRSSGPLAADAQVTWYWDVFGVSAEVTVLELVRDERLVFEWGTPGGDDATRVELTFEARPDDRAYVKIVHSGFQGELDEVIAKALDSAGGFSLVLAAAKAWLEFGVDLHIVADKH